MTSALLLLALAAEPAVTQSAEPDVPHVVVSLYPGGMTAGAAYGMTRGGTYFYFPVGVTVPLRADLALDVDVAFSLNRQSFSGGDGASFSVSVGPTWFPWARNALDGFYVGPRFQFEVSQPMRELVLFDANFGGNGPLDLGTNVRRAFLVGFDVGWQFHLGRFVFGPVLGASVGYAFDSQEQVLSPFDRQASFGRRFGNNIVPSVNLELFKFGATF